ncbi:MAG TPA: L-histidine N(alpha)-methyltransferase [Myxococcales bacterium]|jgi:L-histidine N-alpha-methyltransferase|nr:L-histidine N(alpha)-methyltransferase [Myxococcales bacterium]
MDRPSPARKTRRAVLPRAASPRTATLVSLDAETAGLDELRRALQRTPRELPCKYFYDDAGSALFEQITRLDEYYPTRTERALLEARASAILESVGGAALTDVVELGSGAASKTVCLLDAALAAGARPRYVAVDISAHALRRTREILSAARPEVAFEEVLADYTHELPLPARPAGGRRLVTFIGGTIGNDEDPDAIRLLARVREHLDEGDVLLLGANLVTDPAVIHLAYNDPQGVTAAFNRNLMVNVNSVARSRFDPQAFDHHAPYLVERRRVEMWLVARQAMEIDLGRLGMTLRLQQGEGIRTEISRRFRREEILRLIDAAGFTPERWMESPDGRFGLALGVARASLRGL